MVRKLGALEACLNLAIEDAAYWKNVCEEIASLLGGNNAILIPSNPNFRGAWMAHTDNLAPALSQYIDEEWHLNDFRQKTIPIIIRQGYATDDDILESRDEMSKMPYYTDFLCKHNIGFFIGLKLITPNGIWVSAVYFDNDHPPITDEQIELTKAISALFEKKVAKADEVAHKKIADFAQFFKDTKSRIYIYNPQGENCLSVNSVGEFNWQNAEPNFLSYSITNEIYHDLHEICTSDPELSLSRSYTYTENGRRINLLAIQVPPFLRHFHMPFKVCVIATESNENIAQKHNQLRDRFNLTNSEVTTLELLAGGNKVNAISELLSLKSSTIRQRLKTIYQKAHVSGQIELVNLYHKL